MEKHKFGVNEEKYKFLNKNEIFNLKKRKCPICPTDIDENEFTSELSRKEFTISGLCQQCQDKIFSGFS